MKLHLPKPLRNSVLACIAAVAGIATPTLGTATFAGGVVAFTLASQQAMADWAPNDRYSNDTEHPNRIVYYMNGDCTVDKTTNETAANRTDICLAPDSNNLVATIDKVVLAGGDKLTVYQNPWTDNLRNFGALTIEDIQTTDGGAIRLEVLQSQNVILKKASSGLSAIYLTGDLTLDYDATFAAAGCVTGTGTLSIGAGKTMALDHEGANGSVQSNIKVLGGATLDLKKNDALGWGSEGVSPALISMEGTNVGGTISTALMQLNETTQTLASNLALNGYTSVLGGKLVTYSRTSEENLVWTVTGTDNVISSDISMRRALRLDVQTDSSLDITGRIFLHNWQPSNAALITKEGAGTVTFGNSAETINSFDKGYVNKAGSTVIAGSGAVVSNALKIEGGTFKYAEGALTLNGSLELHDGAALETTTDSAITFGENFKIDLSNLTAVAGEGNVMKYTILTGSGNKTLEALNVGSITGVITLGKSWTFGSDGCISYVVTTKDLVWSGDNLTWNPTGTEFSTGGQFSNGDNVTFTGSSNVTVNESGVIAMSLTVEGEGTLVKLMNGNHITTELGTTIKDGATLELTTKLGWGDKGVVRGVLTVEDGGTLRFSGGDVTGYNGGSDSLRIINVAAGGTLELSHNTNETFAGTLNLDGALRGTKEIDGQPVNAIWDMFGGSSTIIVSDGANAVFENVQLRLRQAEGVVTVGEGATLTLMEGVSKNVAGETYAGVLVKRGAGSLVIEGDYTAGDIVLNGGSLEFSSTNDVNVTLTSGSSFVYNGSATVNAGDLRQLGVDAPIVINNGILKFTGADQEDAVNRPGFVKLFDNLVTTGDGKAVVEGNVVFNYTNKTAPYCTATLSGALEVTGNLNINSYDSSNSPDGDSMRRWVVETGGSLTVGMSLNVTNYQKMIVAGGEVNATGGVVIGHGQNDDAGKHRGKLQIDSGSVTTAGVGFNGGNNVLELNGGTLTFEPTNGEVLSGGSNNNSNKLILNGGVLKATTSNWTLTGSANHNVVFSGSTIDVANGKVATLAGTLMLNRTLAKTGNGSLSFASGTTLTLDASALGALEKGDSVTYTDFDGSTVSGNGFMTGKAYLVTGGYLKQGTLTVQVGGETLKYSEDATGLALNVSGNSVYCVNKDTVTLTETKQVSSFSIASGATLEYSAGDFANTTISGSGTYDMGNGTNAPKTGLTDAALWQGTVKLTAATVAGNGLSMHSLGNANSTIHLNGVSGWINVGNFDANLILSNPDADTAAWTINNGNSNSTNTYRGDISGDGSLYLSLGDPNNVTHHFTGDISGWKAATEGAEAPVIKVTNNKTHTLRFGGDASVVNVKLDMVSNAVLNIEAADGVVFNQSINATKFSVMNGSTVDLKQNVTLAGNIELQANAANHLILWGNANLANTLDLSKADVAEGILELKSGASLTINDKVWLRSASAVQLQENASLTWNDTKVIGTGASSTMKLKDGANQGSVDLQSANLLVSNSVFQVSKDSDKNVQVQLVNSTVVNEGAGKLTLVNDNNVLAGANASKGNIVVRNSSADLVSLGTVTAAEGKSVSAEMQSAQVSAITLGAGATFSTTGALTVADGSALSLGAGAGISMKGALTLGSGLAITVSDVTKDTTLFSGVTSIATSLDDITAYISSINGLTDLSDYTLELDGTKLVLVVDKGKIVNWSASNSIWEDGAQFGTTTEDIDKFANGDAVVFGTLETNEEVTIKGEIHALSMDVAAGAGKTYTFSAAANGGTLTVPSLSITSGTAVFGANTIQLDSLAEVAVGQTGVLDVSAYGLGAFSKLVTKTTGDGTVLITGHDDAGNGSAEVNLGNFAGQSLELGANYQISKSIAIHGNQKTADNEKETLLVSKNMTVGNVLRVESGATVQVTTGGQLAAAELSIGHGSTGTNSDSASGHVVMDGGKITVGSITATGRQDAGRNTFVMTGGTLELTGTGGIASGIATTITGGTLVADTASWGITGATIGGATVTTSGDYTITLRDTTLTDKLTVSAGKLALTGSVDINPTGGFDAKVDGAPRYYAVGSEQPTDNGFRFLTKVYTLADGDGALDVTGVTSWKMDGTALGTEDYTYADKLLTVNNTADGTLYWVNSGTVNYGASGTEGSEGYVPGADMTGATGLALNGGTIQLNTSLQDGWTIERKATGFINLSGSNVVLKSSQVTGTGSATLTGNGVYDIGSTALGIDGETVVNAVKVSGLKDAANWTGTVVVKDSVGTSNKLGLNELGNANSTVKLVNTQGYLWNGTGSNTLASVDTNVILADSDNDYNAALTIANGSSKSERENEGYVMSTFTKKVSGTGNMAFSWTAGYTGLAFTGDVSEWTGAFIVTAGNDTGNGHVNLKFSGDANVIKADLKRSAADCQQLMVYLDDAGATDTTAGITMHGSIEATKLTLGLADDTADSRATVKLNNSVTVDTLTNYAATTLAGDQNLTVDTLTNAGTLTVNGTLVDGAAVTNDGTLELTQAAATLASLAGTGSVTAESLTLTGAATGSNGITADSLTLQGATNTVGALTLDTLTLGVAAVKNADGVITTAGVASTLVTTGQLSVTGDVKVLTLGAGITETTGDVTTSYGMLKAAGLAGTLNFVIAEDELTRYMGTSNTLTLATITGLTTTDVSLNKVAGNTQWSDMDHAWTDSEGQYTYKLSVDTTNGTLTLTRENLGIIWNGAPDEKWVMDVENDGVADTMSWTDKSGTTDLAYTGAESVIFDGRGFTGVIISGDVETKNVNINAEDKTYTFTGDATTKLVIQVPADPEDPETLIDKEYDIIDTLTIQNKLSVLKGTLKADAGLDVYAVHSVEVLNGAALELLSGASVHALAGISNAGTVTIGASSETQGAAALYVEGEGSVNNSGTMVVNGTLLAGYGMGVAANGSNINNSGTLTNAGMIKADGNLDNSGTYTQTAGSLTVYGNVLNTGSVTETTPAGGMNITDGYAVVGGNLTNDGDMSISGGAQTRVDDLYEEDCDNLEVGGNLVNTGTFTVSGEGTKVTVGDVDNDGTLSVAGGSMTVTGNLDNTDGDIIIGTAAVADNPETDENETQAATNGTLSVKGNLTHAGNGDIVVNSGSSLDVAGDLAADGMTLDFDGSVTVGGTAELKDLTIAEGATFTAENATITGVLDNDGSLTVTTTEVKDENGNPVLDKDNNKTYTGGQLSIGTLTGAGVVHVEEGGTLSIGSSVNFTGTLTGEGKLTTGNQAFTLLTKQDEVTDVALATDISAKSLVVAGQWMNDAGEVVAEGTPGAKWASANGSILGEVATDSITFTKLDTTGNKHLTMESLQAYSTSTASGVTQVEVALSQLDTEEGVAELIKTGVHTYNLLSYVGGTVNLTLADMAYDREQQLWKSGLKLGELTSATTMALRAAGTNVSISVLNQSLADATWNTAGETTGIGLDLGTLTNGTMVLKGNDMLDKVQSVNVTKDVTLDLSSTDTNAVKVNGLTGGKTLNIAGNGDVVNVSTVAGGFDGTLGLDNVQATVSGKLDTVKLTNKTVADLAVTNTNVEALTSGLTLNGSMKGGKLSISKAAGVKGTLKIDGTDLIIAYDDKGALSMSTANVATTGQVLVNMDKTTGEAGDIFIGKDGVASKLMEKYYANVRFEDNKGVVADRNTVYYTSKLADSSSTDNGKAGLAMADEALLNANPQGDTVTGDLAAVLDELDTMVATGNKAAADELGASLAGASTAVLGMAAMGDVDRQLRAIRNRTTTMGVDQSVVNADMPYFNAWINAEGDSREMGDDGTLGGYKLNSYGGTVGFDVDIEPTLTAGMALTAMYGDLDATGTDKATGNLDSYYVSAFARYCGSAWTHTFVGTIGMGDISLDRTVGSAQVKGETDSMSFGLMYEVGRVYAMDEDGTTCLQPVFNVTWKHTTVDAYTEKGGDVALSVDEQSLDTITFGLGARLQTVVGESMYNRTSIFECRLLAKADAGDTEGTSKVALGSSASHEVKSNEMGAIGIEVGAGLTIPLGDEGSSIFMDASAEIRADYTDVNGTVGYRVNF